MAQSLSHAVFVWALPDVFKICKYQIHPPFPSFIPELTTAAPQGFPATTAFEKKVRLQKSNYRDDNLCVRAATTLSWMDLCKDLGRFWVKANHKHLQLRGFYIFHWYCAN